MGAKTPSFSMFWGGGAELERSFPFQYDIEVDLDGDPSRPEKAPTIKGCTFWRHISVAAFEQQRRVFVLDVMPPRLCAFS